MMDNAGPDRAILFAVVILQRRQVVKCVQFTGELKRFLLGTGRMPHPVGGAMGRTASLP